MAAKIYLDAHYRDQLSGPAKQSAEKVRGSFTQLKGAIAALGIGAMLLKIKTALIGLSKEGEEAERIWRKLRFQVEMSGKDWAGLEKPIRDFLTHLQQTTEYGDEETAQALDTIALSLGDFDKALVALPLALDLATAGQMDLAIASRYTALALAGDATMLGRYFAKLRGLQQELGSTATAQDKTNYFLDVYAETMAGKATQGTDDAAGALKRYRNWQGDLRHTMGETLNQGIQPLVEGLTDTTQSYTDLLAIGRPVSRLFLHIATIPIGLAFSQWASDATNFTFHFMKLADKLGLYIKTFAQVMKAVKPEMRSLWQAIIEDVRELRKNLETFGKPGELEIPSWYADYVAYLEKLRETFAAGGAGADGAGAEIQGPPIPPTFEQLAVAEENLANWGNMWQHETKETMRMAEGYAESAFSSIFSGILHGSKNTFDTLLNMFLDMLLQMAAAAAAKGLFSMFTKVGGGAFTPFTNLLQLGIPGLQHGYEGWVTKPSLFVAGEAGPEHVRVTPRGRAAPPTSLTINVYAMDAQSVADEFVFGETGRRIRYLTGRGF